MHTYLHLISPMKPSHVATNWSAHHHHQAACRLFMRSPFLICGGAEEFTFAECGFIALSTTMYREAHIYILAALHTQDHMPANCISSLGHVVEANNLRRCLDEDQPQRFMSGPDAAERNDVIIRPSLSLSSSTENCAENLTVCAVITRAENFHLVCESHRWKASRF
jgi:hypothetical protein